jgi:dephospho-CoA kinase
MSNKVVCIVGMAGSGKSIVSDEFVRHGFQYLRFGQITLDTIKEKGLELNEANEKKIREGFRKEHGMAAYAIINIPKLDELLKSSNVVVDGLYSWSEYKILREKYGDFMKVVAVFSPPETRYERLENRAVANDEKQRFRSFTKEEAMARDYSEIENIEKGGPIAMASYTIINTGTVEELKKRIQDIMDKI